MIFRMLLPLVFAMVVLIALPRNPAFGTTLCLGYLALVGALRRWIEYQLGPVANDPLLLAVPAIVFLTAIQVAPWKDTRFHTPLTRSATWLLIIMAIQAFNPLQGSVAVGLSGVLFYIVPVLWFFIAREKATLPVINAFFLAIIAIGIGAAAYGLKQTWFGFTPWEAAWLDKMRRLGSYEALNVGVIRAFSFFTSASEYASFLGITFVVLWARVLMGKVLALLPMTLIAVAIFLESSRGIIVFTLFACAVMWAVQSHSKAMWIFRGTVAVLVALTGMSWLMMHLNDAGFDERVNSLVEHQVEGLADPFGETSTAPGHASRIGYGITYGILHPWGAGLGATTIGAGKFGGVDLGTEGDLSNLFVSLGIVGGILYAVLIFRALRTAILLWQKTKHAAGLTILGILLVQLLGWLNTSQYSTVMVIWFCLGALDRMNARVLLKNRLISLVLNSEEKTLPEPCEGRAGYA